MEKDLKFKDLFTENVSFFYTKDYFTGISNFWENVKTHIENDENIPLDLGIFIFEEKEKDKFECIKNNKIDIVSIQLSALFLNLRKKRELNKNEKDKYAKYLKSETKYRLDWIEEHQLYRDYVIDQIEVDLDKIDTISSKKIVNVFDKYNKYFSTKDELFLLNWLHYIENARCTIVIQTAEEPYVPKKISYNILE